MSKKKKYRPVFKTKVAVSAIREEGTLSELSAKYGVNANMISKWKKQALDNMSSVFSSKSERSAITNSPYAEVEKKEVKIYSLKD